MCTVIESLSTQYFAQLVILLDSRVPIGVVMHVSCRAHSLLSHWVFSGGNWLSPICYHLLLKELPQVGI